MSHMDPGETFTAQERARLAPFVSDLDAPVFALMGLPETTRGALFARYSRYPGTLRRLLLDEFGEELDRAHPTASGLPPGRARRPYTSGSWGNTAMTRWPS